MFADARESIVAVHGLGGDAFRTWTARNGTFWLRDLLPAEVPSARVLSFGYNSDPARWQEPASVNMIHHHAQTLVAELVSFRRVSSTCLEGAGDGRGREMLTANRERKVTSGR